MKELSMHILDLIQNSISAGADLIKVTIEEDTIGNRFIISVSDNGKGMDKATAESTKDPFYTSRTTRKIGLGIPLLLAAAQRCDGDLTIDSHLGEGTRVTAYFKYDHIDRAPLGNVWSMMSGVIACNGDIDFEYTHIYNGSRFQMKTKDIKNILKDVPITSPEVTGWIEGYLRENIDSLYGGAIHEDNPGTGRNKKENFRNPIC